MSKFREIDLAKNLKKFENNTNIELLFEKGLNGKIILEKATVKYDNQYGFINIEGKNVEFKVNTTLVEKYENNNDQIEINMESILLKIRRI